MWAAATAHKRGREELPNVRGQGQKPGGPHARGAAAKRSYPTSHAKAFDCVDHNKLWKILQEMGIPDNLTCLLRNLYAGQEATVRTGHVLRSFKGPEPGGLESTDKKVKERG